MNEFRDIDLPNAKLAYTIIQTLLKNQEALSDLLALMAHALDEDVTKALTNTKEWETYLEAKRELDNTHLQIEKFTEELKKLELRSWKMDNKDNVLKDKSYKFALRIVKLYKHLTEDKKEFVLSKQILRSGTSIGANITEGNQAQSTADFIHKLSIALKEAFETEYWLCLLRDAEYLTEKQAESLIVDCNELQKMLTASIKTSKSKL